MNPPIEATPRDATPRLAFEPELLLAALDVQLLLLDVDGVLTPGDLLYGAQGEELKRFSTLDGHGLKLLMSAGIEPVVISGRDSPALRARIAELGLQHSVLGSGAKLPAAQSLLDQLELSWEQVAIIGDDWPDLALIARAGFSAAPPQSHAEVLARVSHITRAPAGLGAVREVCDLLLMARGAYAALLQDALDGKPHTPSPGRPHDAISGTLAEPGAVLPSAR
ncbi:MAG: 3-deoxy-D-manno-octulosonate 8-phosphate phosphatase [Thiomonas sp. 14-64-326]|jgi:3-deoxy-D-manno-octulosonate 8-phosphate phosphatase (KDO 8-P phosphatase)|uniref:KdsC family phosphatase n=1 Tax=Thiomonas sp. TaxID=2047785 RepID=UPI000BD6E555|nr:HAD hydrolase family protein [Thiomonas sp.]OZB73888.1 MAG: 3-deoxy-D-manno-octulosonate 8-phosphate phosphatase [Thiomonas sp. 14-64-326]